MKYDAFISYRHSELDMEIAKKIHAGLETYRIPKAVRDKTGKAKMGRVFRDQEELPIGSDLDDNISEALKGSECGFCRRRDPVLKEQCLDPAKHRSDQDQKDVLQGLQKACGRSKKTVPGCIT